MATPAHYQPIAAGTHHVVPVGARPLVTKAAKAKLDDRIAFYAAHGVAVTLGVVDNRVVHVTVRDLPSHPAGMEAPFHCADVLERMVTVLDIIQAEQRTFSCRLRNTNTRMFLRGPSGGKVVNGTLLVLHSTGRVAWAGYGALGTLLAYQHCDFGGTTGHTIASALWACRAQAQTVIDSINKRK